MEIETYEQAVERTGRKWPYRNADWPCPACGDPDCDLDVTMEQHEGNKFIYFHKSTEADNGN